MPPYGGFNLNFVMDPLIGSALIGGGVSLVNSLAGSHANANLNKTNRRWQEAMAALQYQRQRQLTEDTPKLQKQGLVDAGMSPSALSGFTGPAASVASVPASPSSNPEYVPFDVNTMINAFLASKEADVMDSVKEKNFAYAAKTNKEANRYDELTDATIANIVSETGVNKEEVNRIKANIPLLNNQSDFYNYLASNEDVRLQTALATKQSEIDRIKAQNKLDETAAKHKLEMIDDIINAQYNLTLAMAYNATASGQAQLSNAETNRLRYKMDNALNAYISTYYREAAQKFRSESTDIESFRAARLKWLDNDADYRHALKEYQDNLNSTYGVDNVIENATKVLGSGVGVVNSVTKSGPRPVSGFR